MFRYYVYQLGKDPEGAPEGGDVPKEPEGGDAPKEPEGAGGPDESVEGPDAETPKGKEGADAETPEDDKAKPKSKDPYENMSKQELIALLKHYIRMLNAQNDYRPQAAPWRPAGRVPSGRSFGGRSAGMPSRSFGGAPFGAFGSLMNDFPMQQFFDNNKFSMGRLALANPRATMNMMSAMQKLSSGYPKKTTDGLIDMCQAAGSFCRDKSNVGPCKKMLADKGFQAALTEEQRTLVNSFSKGITEENGKTVAELADASKKMLEGHKKGNKKKVKEGIDDFKKASDKMMDGGDNRKNFADFAKCMAGMLPKGSLERQMIGDMGELAGRHKGVDEVKRLTGKFAEDLKGEVDKMSKKDLQNLDRCAEVGAKVALKSAPEAMEAAQRVSATSKSKDSGISVENVGLVLDDAQNRQQLDKPAAPERSSPRPGSSDRKGG